MDASDIRDKDSLEAWLESQTREVAVTIAHRAAMRVLPAYWEPASITNSRFELMALVIFHANLVSAVAAISENDKIANACKRVIFFLERQVAYGAAYVLQASAWAAYIAVTPPIDVEGDAVTAVSFAVDAHADAFGGVVVPSTTDDSYEVFWSALRADALKAQSGARHAQETHLWSGFDNAHFGAWNQLRSRLTATNDPGWQFWTQWYDAALEGRPLLGDWDRHWALLTDIALLDPKIWDKGPDAVNPAVVEIVETHRALADVIAKTPNGEVIGLDPDTDALTAIPVPGIDGDLRDHITRSIEKAVTRFNAACDTGGASGNFGPTLRACADQDLVYLLEDIAEAAAFDVALHDAIDDCLGSLRRKFAEQGLSADPAAARLMGVLERCTIDIYTSSHPAREAMEKRGEEYYRRISIEHHAQLTQLAQDMAADSVEALQRQMLADLARADDDTADPDQRRRARYRTISRLPRGAEAIRYSRYVDGRRIPDDQRPPKESRLWVATVLGPSFAELLRRFLGG